MLYGNELRNLSLSLIVINLQLMCRQPKLLVADGFFMDSCFLMVLSKAPVKLPPPLHKESLTKCENQKMIVVQKVRLVIYTNSNRLCD